MKRKIEDSPIFYNQIFEGDCVSLAKKYLENESVDLIVTDPPYGIAGKTLDKHYNRNEANVVDGYVDVSNEEYAQFSNEWIKESARVLRYGKRMFIVSGWSHIAEVLSAVELAGLVVINHIIWKYNFGVYTTKKFVSSHYHILLVQKGVFDKDITKWNVKKEEGEDVLEDVWRIKREYKPKQVKNKNQLPSILLQRMIRLASDVDDVVVDFFAGSGSTVVESIKMGRIGCGFEINHSAYEFASENLRQIIGTNRQKNIDSDLKILQNPSNLLTITPNTNTNTNTNTNPTFVNTPLVDLIISQIPLMTNTKEEEKQKYINNIQHAVNIVRSGGSIFFIVSPNDLLFILNHLHTIKSLIEINHLIWCWTPSENAIKRALDSNRLADSHLHLLFFAKKGAERTFNRFCRFSESVKTTTGGSACYSDMEDVWNFNETFDESFPIASNSLIQKIVLYCSNPNDVIADVFSSPLSSSDIYKSIVTIQNDRKMFNN